jgi:F-type H+-transporting ATPase subunit a
MIITNLFSVFDPSSIFNLPLNWASSLIFLIILSPLYWVTPTKIFILTESVVNKLHSEFKTLLGPSSFVGRSIIFVSLFIFILVNNFIGLFPYIFTASRHIALTLTLSLPLWISFILYGWFNYTKHIFAHLVPQRTPGALIPFIVLIESIRNVIRPLTLAVRLIANIVAGHLLITLLGNQTAIASGIILTILIFTQIILLTLECAVAIIQSYVFAVLSTLYAREITSH